MNEAKSESDHGHPGDDLQHLAADAEAALNRAVKTVEFGRRGFAVAVTVFVLVVGLVLPWVDGHAGWQVLLGRAEAIPQLFAATATGFGVLASAVALATRRWWLTWVCAVGGWFAFVDGILAIWSQQSATAADVAGGGPGVGLVLSAVAMAVLAAQWMRLAWSRS